MRIDLSFLATFVLPPLRNFSSEPPVGRNLLVQLRFDVVYRLFKLFQFFFLTFNPALNGDQFPFSDRVGNIGRNTYRGDASYTTGIRIQRGFFFDSRVRPKVSAEVSNLLQPPECSRHRYRLRSRDFPRDNAS